ncbi:S24/S26 family peptidase [Methanobrevibacter sp.]|uniref:S24/S26 family peptidase n=1 Tax=Methanobrevibacter sp. TaxID=66852 RepID=UPI0025E2C987|nr:S24/S26 family peptidase [Methanobrevibacter sp.]MBQ2665410.1 S24/S26 family peptidase [Methanobrevibacter sp.]
MAKKIILAVLVLILIIVCGIALLGNNSVDIYNDGENVTVETTSFSNVDKNGLSNEICRYTLEVMNDTSTNITSYRNGIEDICKQYGLEDVEINIDSSIGPNQIPVIVYVDGTSMLPTLQDGQFALFNKTHDVHVGDIVVADSEEYGGIIKRVDQINGNDIHLVSDNKNISYEFINGELYEIKGISTWVDVSDINGVVISY